MVEGRAEGEWASWGGHLPIRGFFPADKRILRLFFAITVPQGCGGLRAEIVMLAMRSARGGGEGGGVKQLTRSQCTDVTEQTRGKCAAAHIA